METCSKHLHAQRPEASADFCSRTVSIFALSTIRPERHGTIAQVTRCRCIGSTNSKKRSIAVHCGAIDPVLEGVYGTQGMEADIALYIFSLFIRNFCKFNLR